MNSDPDKKAPVRRISDLTDEQLATFEANYRKRQVRSGGIFSLDELVREKQRRLAKQWNIPGLLRVILENRQVGDGLTLYKELWNVLFPGEAWKGRYSVKIVMEALDALNRYIVAEGLPLHTILVVNSATRTLRAKAIESLYFRCRELGREVGPDVDAFVERERARALAN